MTLLLALALYVAGLVTGAVGLMALGMALNPIAGGDDDE